MHTSTELPITQITLQESLNRPVSGSDFGFDIPLKTRESLNPITGSAETLEGFRVEDEDAEQLAAKSVPFERKFLHQMSSGFGTQQNDSRGGYCHRLRLIRHVFNPIYLYSEDATFTESIELRALGPINSTDTDPGLIMTESEALNDNNSNNIDNTLGAKSPATSNCNDLNAHQEVVTGGRVRHAVKLTQAAAGQSATLPPISSNISDRRQSNTLGSGEDHALLTTAVAASSNPVSSASSPRYHRRWEIVSSPQALSPPVRRSPSYMRSMNRIPSDNSIQSLSTDKGTPYAQHSEFGTPAKAASSNLREELLNCEQKELFQFLHEDFDNSNNYFSDTVGFGAATFDPDTDSLVFDGARRESSLASDRKVSSGSLRSNLSSISNSIFQTLEMRRGGSFSGSIDKVIQRLESPSVRKRYSDNVSQKDMEREPLVGNSEFDCLIESFDKSLTDLKNKSCLSLDRNISKHLPSGGLTTNPDDLSKSNSSSNTSAQDTGTVIRRARSSSARNFDRTSGSVKLKRRSLEKQKKVHDDEFEPLTEVPNILKSPPQSNGSPTMRIRRSFNNSYDRIKRSSLIERVEEEFEGGERMPLRVESEKLPRKEFKINEDLLKKRHHSDENVKQSTDELSGSDKGNKFTAHPSDLQKLPRSVPDSVIVDMPSETHPGVPGVVESPSSKSLKSSKSGKSSTSSKKSKKRKKSPKSGKVVKSGKPFYQSKSLA